MNPDCNPTVSRTVHANACLAARIAAAAGAIGGNDAFWAMHVWLIEHPRKLDPYSIRQACPALGLDADALFQAIVSNDASAFIAEDARLGKDRGLAGVPFIWINNRQVARTRLDKKLVLEQLLEAAAE